MGDCQRKYEVGHGVELEYGFVLRWNVGVKIPSFQHR